MKVKPMLVVSLLVWGLMTVTLIGYGSRWWRIAEYAASLRAYLFGGSVVLFVLMGLLKRKIGVVVLFCAFLNGLAIAPYTIPRPTTPPGDIRLLVSNIDKHYVPYVGVDGVIAMLETAAPDIAILRETGEKEAAAITTAAAAKMPYTFAYQDIPTDGILILSRYPLANARPLQMGGGRHVIVADLTIDTKTVHLVAPHPTNPLYSFDERNTQLAAVAAYAQTAPRPLIMAGDLNVTMWSYWYKQIAQTGLENARRGRGILASWDSPIPLVHLPIDHVLVSAEINVGTAELLAATGSDHRPLVVTLTLD